MHVRPRDLPAILRVLAEIPARRRIVVLADVSEARGGQGPTYRRLGERIARVLAAVDLVKGDLLPGDVVLIKGRMSQRLERVALALQGGEVRCDIAACDAGAWTPCHRCPMLERGWDGLRVVL